MRGRVSRIVVSALLGLAMAVPSVAALASDFPKGTITIIVPRAPGGGSDNLSRLLQPTMEKKLGVPVVIENRPDASAVLGAQLVSRAKPDGYTLYFSDNAFYQNPAIIKDLPYDPIADFSGIIMLAQSPVILTVHPDVPVKTAKELVKYAKEKAGKLTYSHGGIGASTHLAGIQLNMAAGTNIVHVPYASSGPALNALLGGHVTMHFGGINSSKSHVKAGSLRAIGLTGGQRASAMPDVPTLKEAGVPGVEITSLWGVHAPAGTPLEIRKKLRDAFVESMADPDVKKRLDDLGYTPIGNTPEEHQTQTKELIEYWRDVGKRVNLSK